MGVLPEGTGASFLASGEPTIILINYSSVISTSCTFTSKNYFGDRLIYLHFGNWSTIGVRLSFFNAYDFRHTNWKAWPKHQEKVSPLHAWKSCLAGKMQIVCIRVIKSETFFQVACSYTRICSSRESRFE